MQPYKKIFSLLYRSRAKNETPFGRKLRVLGKTKRRWGHKGPAAAVRIQLPPVK